MTPNVKQYMPSDVFIVDEMVLSQQNIILVMKDKGLHERNERKKYKDNDLAAVLQCKWK
jgi:hypothetical protein